MCPSRRSGCGLPGSSLLAVRALSRKAGSFQGSALQLIDEPLTADAFVRLSEGEIGSTRIVVVNRRTHESRVAATRVREESGKDL